MYIGVRDGTPYCLQIQAQDEFSELRYRYVPDAGPCRLYARYGWPGPRVGEWLEAGGLRFASGERRPIGVSDNPARTLLESVDAPVFGLRRLPMVDRYPPGGRCLAGSAADCAALVADLGGITLFDVDNEAYVVANSPLTYGSRLGSAQRFSSIDAVFLDDVESYDLHPGLRSSWPQVLPKLRATLPLP